jgi:hypothetical protein
MKGKGYYDQHSTAQAESIRLLHGYMEEAIREVPLPTGPWPMVLADFGCSEGRNSSRWMNRVVDAVRMRTERPIFTFFSDLPTNDYNSLFTNLNNPELSGGPRPDVYRGAVAGSFYTQLLPTSVAHFESCINAILYLDHLPAPVPDFVIYQRPRVYGEETAFSRQAEADLTRFLACRARELVSGGKLLIATPGHDGRQHSCEEVYYVLNDACTDLVKDGRLTQAQFERITIPAYFRTAAELRAPVEKDTPVRGLYRVDCAETLEVPTPFVVQYREERIAQNFADGYTGFIRAFTEPVVRAAVAGTPQEDVVVDAVFQRLHARLLAEPERYLFHYVLTVVVLTRN